MIYVHLWEIWFCSLLWGAAGFLWGLIIQEWLDNHLRFKAE